jgi:hypothetical protein
LLSELVRIEVFRAYLTFKKCRPLGEEDDEYLTKIKDRQTRTATENDNAVDEASESNLLLVESFIVYKLEANRYLNRL